MHKALKYIDLRVEDSCGKWIVEHESLGRRESRISWSTIISLLDIFLILIFEQNFEYDTFESTLIH